MHWSLLANLITKFQIHSRNSISRQQHNKTLDTKVQNVQFQKWLTDSKYKKHDIHMNMRKINTPIYIRGNIKKKSLCAKNKSKGDTNFKLKLCILGSGHWGSAIAKVVGRNAACNPLIDSTVPMYVRKETVNGQNLHDIINKTHENIKYLPGHKLPKNVYATPDVVEAAKDAHILILVIPHQLIACTCRQLRGKINPSAQAISLNKGFIRGPDGKIDLISRRISCDLGIPCSVLMGANIAKEVANDSFCETTVASSIPWCGEVFHDIFQTEHFKITLIQDLEAVECCGALKDIIAIGAGIVDGMKFGYSTKSAVVRLGMLELIEFVKIFYSSQKLETYFKSCGMVDIIATCAGGPNYRAAKEYLICGKSIKQFEKEILKGQKLQGPIIAQEVHDMLCEKNLIEKFPVFTTIHKIIVNDFKPPELINNIINHPTYKLKSKEGTKSDGPNKPTKSSRPFNEIDNSPSSANQNLKCDSKNLKFQVNSSLFKTKKNMKYRLGICHDTLNATYKAFKEMLGHISINAKCIYKKVPIFYQYKYSTKKQIRFDKTRISLRKLNRSFLNNCYPTKAPKHKAPIQTMLSPKHVKLENRILIKCVKKLKTADQKN